MRSFIGNRDRTFYRIVARALTVGFALANFYLAPSAVIAKTVVQPDKFPFGFYAIGHEAVDSVESCEKILHGLKQKGITLIGPYYGSSFSVLKKSCYTAAAHLDLDSVYYIPIIEKRSQQVTSFLKPDLASRFRQQNDLTEQVDRQVEFVSSNPDLKKTVKWWGILPEELRPWKKEEMDYLAALIESIRSSERKRGLEPRPIMMYETSNRREKLLELTGKFLDVQAIGTYEKDQTEASAIKAVSDSATAVAKSASINGNYPVVTLSLNKPYPPSFSPSDVRKIIRRNTYIALIKGAKGILIWSWATREGLSSKDRDLLVDAYASVASDLNGPPNLGQVLLHGNQVTIQYQNQKNDILIRAVDYKSDLYIFLANIGRSNAQITLESLPSKQADALLTLEKYDISPSGKLNLSLEKYDVTVLKIPR